VRNITAGRFEVHIRSRSDQEIHAMVSTDYFFEGVEKLLEIWFAPDTEENHDGDLRRIPRSEWDNLVKSVNAQILSVIENDDIQAFLLSESSLLVSKRRVIIKTCGTTKCLQARFQNQIW